MGKKKLTSYDINERINKRGLILTGEYISNKQKTSYRCEYGHEWLSRTDVILRGRGCPTCYNNIRSSDQRLSVADINERLSTRGLVLIGPYTTNKKKTLFTCLMGHEWEARADNVLNGSGCIYCPRPPHPRTGGYKKSLPGWCYVLEYETFIKYGITNVPDRRLAEHRTSGVYTIRMLKRHEDGTDAVKWERDIKKRFGGSYVDSNVMLTGYTETLPKEVLNEIIK